MPRYMVHKDNKHAIASIDRMQKVSDDYIICTQKELDEFNVGTDELTDKTETPSECATTSFHGIQQAMLRCRTQQQRNLDLAKILEVSAKKPMPYIAEPAKIPRSHFIKAASHDIAHGIDPTSVHSHLQILMQNFIEEGE